MQILVLYFSKGGNTRKLAEAVAEGVESVEGASALVKSTHEVSREDFLNAAGIIAGSPVYFGGMAAGLKKILKNVTGKEPIKGNKLAVVKKLFQKCCSRFWKRQRPLPEVNKDEKNAHLPQTRLRSPIA